MNKREVKFNAWLPELEIMIEGVTVGYSSIGFPYMEDGEFEKKLAEKKWLTKDNYDLPDWIYEGDDWWQIEEGHFELLQFTGKKDKAGTEIYEGHIISFDEKEFGGENTSVVEWNEMYACWDLGGGTASETEEWKTVIGNKFQNPELLK